MSKILDSVSITVAAPKMLETGYNMIINGQVHEKATLEPIKFNYINTRCTNTLALNSHYHLDHDNTLRKFNEDLAVVDIENPNLSYSFSILNSEFIIHKTELQDDNKEVLIKSVAAAHTSIYMKFLCQDANYLFYQFWSNANLYIMKTRKSDLFCWYLGIGNLGEMKLIKDDGAYLYLLRSVYTDQFYYSKVNKADMSVSNIIDDSGTNTKATWMVSTIAEIKPNQLLSVRNTIHFTDDAPNKVHLRKYIIDGDKMLSKDLILDCSILPEGNIPLEASDLYKNTWILEKFISNTSTYVMMWNKRNKNIYLLKEINDSEFAVIQYYELSEVVHTHLRLKNSNTCLFISRYKIMFLTFNEDSETIELSSEKGGDYLSVGVDKNQMVWVQNRDTSVSILSQGIAYTAKVEFEEKSISYTGVDIESYVDVYCSNYLGSLVVSNLEVILIGSAVFKDTGLKRKTIKTNASSVNRLPVVIKEAGHIEASVSIL